MESSGGITILRWGLAFVFFYAAIASLLDSPEWVGLVPGFLGSVASPTFFLTMLSLYELILAAFLFWGKHLRWSSLLATISFIIAVVANYQAMDIVYRDIGLAFAALALYQLSRHQGTVTS